MAFAQGSLSSLSYIKEVTFGVTPAGNFKELPFTSHSLNASKTRVSGTDITGDRMLSVDRHGNKRTGGDIVIDLRDADLDELLELAMFNTWDTSPVAGPDILKTGTTLQSVSIEDAARDINQFRVFSGQAVSSMGVSIAPDQMVTATFSFLGKDVVVSGTGKTVDAHTGAQPFDAYSGDISIGDVASATANGTVSSINFTVDNGLNPLFVIGENTTPQLEYGDATVTGTAAFYFESDAIMNRFLNEVESELIVSVNDPTGLNEYTFGFPRIKINSADVPVAGSGTRLVTCEFVALKDSTTGTNFYIERPETI